MIIADPSPDRRLVVFYFDLVSPFSYLAHVKLPALVARYGHALYYHPMDIPAAKLAAGNYGPSNREVPAKLAVIRADLMRWARHYGVPLNFPRGFDCTLWNIGALYAREQGRAGEFVGRGYARIWGAGIDPADQDELRRVAIDAGLDAEALIAYAQSSQGRTDFRRSCVDAQRAGVFGAPMMRVGTELFWGNDRLMFLEAHLAELADG